MIGLNELALVLTLLSIVLLQRGRPVESILSSVASVWASVRARREMAARED